MYQENLAMIPKPHSMEDSRPRSFSHHRTYLTDGSHTQTLSAIRRRSLALLAFTGQQGLHLHCDSNLRAELARLDHSASIETGFASYSTEAQDSSNLHRILGSSITSDDKYTNATL